MKACHFTPQFVESIPETLDQGVLYVSMTLASAIHLCACGCELTRELPPSSRSNGDSRFAPSFLPSLHSKRPRP
jgi:hypothetical protein